MVRDNKQDRRARVKKKKSSSFFRKLIIYTLLISAILAYLFWLWNRIYFTAHRFYSITFLQNDQIKRILDGEKIRFHPKDKVKIIHISTNVPFNYHVRLFCKDIDIESLLYRGKRLISILPSKDIFRLYDRIVHVRFEDQDIGKIRILIKPSFEDWLAKYNEINELNKKRDFLDIGLSLFPEKEEELIGLRLSLAKEYEENRKIEDAIKEYLAILNYAEKLKKDTLFSVYESLIRLFIKTKKYKAALRYCQFAIDAGDKNPEIYYNMYKLYNKLGKKEKAAYYLSELLKLKPKDVESRIELAKTLLETGDIDRADRYVSEALSIDPNNIDALILKAKILDKKGNKKALIQVYKKILSIQPENEVILYNLAALEYEIKDMDSALKHIRAYIVKRPNDKDAHELLFQIYRAKKMDDMAYKEAKILIELSPRLTYPYYFLFNYLWPKGRCKEILPYMIKGIRYNPRDITLRKYIVLCYLLQGKDALAIRQIRIILKLKPNDVGTMLQLARLMEKRGDYLDALKIYKKILKIAPDNEEAQDGYLRLKFKTIEEKEKEVE